MGDGEDQGGHPEALPLAWEHWPAAAVLLCPRV